MAGWKTDKDIARDMDILSGIRSPEEKIKSYTTYGRGRQVHAFSDVSTFPEPQEKTKMEEFKWFPEAETPGKLPDSIGRGKKLELLKANICRSKEMEVHEQLREVMGPGYSNDFIEESFKKRLGVKNERKSLPIEQFQDSEEMQPISDKLVEGESEGVMLNADSTSHEVEEPKRLKRRGRKRYRNALLESLERMNSGKVFEDENADTDGTSSTTKTGPMFGTKSSNIFPACYLPGKSCVTASPGKNPPENSFEYNESEFPHL